MAQVNLLAVWAVSPLSCIPQRHGVDGWPDLLTIPCSTQLFLTESPESINQSHGEPVHLKTFSIFPWLIMYLIFFICLSVKPSVAVTGQNVDNKNKRMLMEQFHEMLTRKLCTTGDVMERGARETLEAL